MRESANLGVWESGSITVWEPGSLGVWKGPVHVRLVSGARSARVGGTRKTVRGNLHLMFKPPESLQQKLFGERWNVSRGQAGSKNCKEAQFAKLDNWLTDQIGQMGN